MSLTSALYIGIAVLALLANAANARRMRRAGQLHAWRSPFVLSMLVLAIAATQVAGSFWVYVLTLLALVVALGHVAEELVAARVADKKAESATPGMTETTNDAAPEATDDATDA